MSKSLEHRQIHGVISALAEAKIINLDATIKNLMTPVAESLAKHNVGSEVSLHIVCCNEYGLITGLTGGGLEEIKQLAESIRSSVGR